MENHQRAEESITSAQMRAARALLGWSQQDLARRAQVASSTVADFERGQRTPVPNNLGAMRSSLEGAGIAFLTGGAIVGPPPKIASAKSGGVPIRWIDATDLSHWADRRDGQDTMPELLSRLIRAAKGHSASLNFPSGDSVQQSGWDGVCEVVEGGGYVPQGCSGWEIGTQRKNIRKKADTDYEKRSAEPLGLERSHTTFVFVTPRRWSKKREWARKRKAEGKWADVKVYDADDLVHWIELFPPVGHWLAVLIGKRPQGIRQLTEAWQEWSLSTKWPMTADLLLAGRDEEATRVLRWLYGAPSALAVQADSTSEAVAFLHAATEQLPPDYRVNYQGRCLIAPTSEVARLLGDSPSSLIIVLQDADAGLGAQLAQEGHHVYIVHGSEIGAPEDAICLPRPPWEAFSGALVGMGVEQESAGRLTRESARSLSVLRRLIPSVPGRVLPEWAEADHARGLVATLLAGAWNEAQDGDRKALERLSGETYETISSRLVRWISLPDSPFRKAGSAWKVASPRDAWFRLAPHVTSIDLDRFASVATDVLGSPDPRFDMKPDERWLSSFHGRKSEYSALLRTGVSETLVLLSVFGDQVRYVTDAGQRAEAVVRKLLDGANSQRWWSMSPHLQVLAEASPDVFLEALDENLAQPNPPVMALFVEDAGPLGGAHHSELLWALEILAWSPRYIARVAELLAKLARLDPGGRYANRPANSLLGIFRLWMPQTNVSLDERLRVLERLGKTESEVAWRLMLGLLPGAYDTASPSPQTRWRDFTTGEEEIATYGVIGRGADVIAGRLLEDVKLNNTRWRRLFELFPNLPPDRRKQAVERLLAAAPSINDDKTRVEIWEALRGLLHHHRAFPDAEWALPAEQLESIEKAYIAIEPRGGIERLAWLFSKPGADLPTPAQKDWQADEETSAELRRTAVQKLINNREVDTIFALASAAKMPVLVGIATVEAVGRAEQKEAILFTALHRGDPASQGLALGMIHAFCKRDGEAWADTLLSRAEVKGWPKEVIVRALLLMPLSKRTWKHAAAFGKEVEDLYWSRTSILGIDNEPESMAFAIGKLLEAGRARHATYLAGHYGKGLTSELLVRTLTEAAQQPWPEGADTNEGTMFPYSVEELLQRLDEAGDVPEDQIARLEWTYLQLLEHSRRPPKVLHKTMSVNPAFFVEVLSAIYRPATDSGVQETIESDPKRARAIASQAYGLLRSWRRVPGEASGIVDSAALEEWVKHARLLCAQADRAVVGDQHIGSLLASAPPDADGIWPTKAVREVIEITRSRKLENGVLLGVHNSRGATWRGLTDGGAQERLIANRYREWAETTELEWPRTSALLERIAKSFEEHGQWHDQDAERTDWSL